MSLAPYVGPSVFGYETDGLRRVAAVSVHTSPLATLGGTDAGGMNVYIRELSCHTAESGLPVDVFVRRTNPDVPETVKVCDGVNVVSIAAGPPHPIGKNDLFPYLPEFAAEMALYSLRHGVRYDVVHAHYWLSGWVAHILKRYWATPFVQMFHTTAHMKNAVSPDSERESQLRFDIERRLVGLADSLIAANPDERADLIWRQRTPAEKICTIPPGVDVALFRPLDAAESRAAVGLDHHRPIVLFVGRIDPIKGLDTLLSMAAELDVTLDPLIVVVGGDLSPDGQPLGALADFADQISRRSLTNRFRLVGSQPQNELSRYYAASDVVVVPSRYESFGLVAVEAMACARPVVASRSGGLIFTVEDGETGYLAPVGDGGAFAARVNHLLFDPVERAAMGDRARVAASRFAWTSIASSIIHVYRGLAAGRNGNLCCAEEIYA